MSYKNLQIWELSREVILQVHEMTMSRLPKHEMYEVGSQMRRSSKSVKANIVEGYGRRRYKAEYVRFLTFAFASCLETTDHLETLFETRSLTDETFYRALHEKLDILGKMLNEFIQGVEREHNA